MIKTVIFDFDGTLANTLEQLFGIYNAHAESWGCKTVPHAEMEKLRTTRPQDFFGGYGLHWWKIPRLVMAMHKEFKKDLSKVVLFEGVPEMITALKERGVDLYIVSSNTVENIRIVLERHDLLHLFSGIYSQSSVFGKHRTLKNLIKTYRLDKATTVYVGDETRDIEAAQRAGVAIISCSWGFQGQSILESLEPTYMAHAPGEILEILS